MTTSGRLDFRSYAIDVYDRRAHVHELRPKRFHIIQENYVLTKVFIKYKKASDRYENAERPDLIQ